jgi:hypothetical protein
MFSFQSEPSIIIQGTEFRVSTVLLLDEQGRQSTSQRASGRDGKSCAWFFVPPAERTRLEHMGVVFEEFERAVVDRSAR